MSAGFWIVVAWFAIVGGSILYAWIRNDDQYPPD